MIVKSMSDEQWIWRCDRMIPSTTAAGRGIVDELVLALESRQWSLQDVFSIQLAVEEAMVNAIMHGNQLHPHKKVRVIYLLAVDLLRIIVIDEGDGFDPAQVPNPTDADRLSCPTGRGLLLMKAFMTRVEYNASGNCVVMEKRREPAEQP